MNLSQIDLGQFLIKFKGLVRKISKSNPAQLESHTQKCHAMITSLIQDDDLLKNLNSSQLRLLAYEAILFLIEVINVKDQDSKSKADCTNKIEIFLTQIYQTLLDIKRLIQSVSTADHFEMVKERKKSFNHNSNFDQVSKNLHQYQKKIGNIITSFQSQNNFNCEKKQHFDNLTEKDDGNDELVEQLQRLIQKNEKKISSQTKLLEKLENQKIDLEVSFKQTINHLQQTNLNLTKQLEDLRVQNQKILQRQQKERQNLLKKEKQSWGIGQKNRIKTQLKITSVLNEQIIKNVSSLKHLHSNNKISQIAQQTLSSLKSVERDYTPFRKMSFDRHARKNSFRRIGLAQDKESVSSEKKMNQINEELYRFIFCQAVTIEELF